MSSKSAEKKDTLEVDFDFAHWPQQEYANDMDDNAVRRGPGCQQQWCGCCEGRDQLRDRRRHTMPSEQNDVFGDCPPVILVTNSGTASGSRTVTIQEATEELARLTTKAPHNILHNILCCNRQCCNSVPLPLPHHIDTCRETTKSTKDRKSSAGQCCSCTCTCPVTYWPCLSALSSLRFDAWPTMTTTMMAHCRRIRSCRCSSAVSDIQKTTAAAAMPPEMTAEVF